MRKMYIERNKAVTEWFNLHVDKFAMVAKFNKLPLFTRYYYKIKFFFKKNLQFVLKIPSQPIEQIPRQIHS